MAVYLYGYDWAYIELKHALCCSGQQFYFITHTHTHVYFDGLYDSVNLLQVVPNQLITWDIKPLVATFGQ